MDPMTDELKETIIREHPDGIWLVLTEENPPEVQTADDMLCRVPYPRPSASD